MIQQARPAVVRIDTRISGGTGAIFEIQGRTAYIITNQHVVEGFAQVTVTVKDSATYTGTVLGTDAVRDLAVVRICCGSFSKLSFGDASRLQPGDEVLAIGYALGLTGEATVSRGIVSAMRYDSDRLSDVIQTDAAINPGNSGGPMLSMDGKIIGINTFRIDRTDSGRSAEGLGFAISASTVQQRVQTLKAARAAPTPTPTRRLRPTPTPFFRSNYGFGPEDGELRHDPSDGLIETKYAAVLLTDFAVVATFTNPYSAATNSWDYGFIIRRSGFGASTRFVQVVVNSRGGWNASWRQGSSSEGNDIANGTLRSFNTSAGGQNSLWLTAIGERGLFFVNGEFVATLDLSPVTGAGDVAVITGAFTGNETAGAVTRYEEFAVGPLTKDYGPASGKLEKETGKVSIHSSRVWTSDLITEATFTSPSGRSWDYGFIIRNPAFNQLEVIGVDGSGRWFHQTRNAGDDDYTEVADGRLTRGLHSSNHLILIALEELGFFFVNGQLIARLDFSHNLGYGDVSAMGGFYNNHTGEPSFENFNVWMMR